MTLKAARIAALLLLAAASAGGGQPAGRRAPFVVAETGQAFRRLDLAVDAIGGGSGTIRIAPGRYRDCAVQEGGRIAFVAVTPGSAIFDGGMCEGKAVLVLRGRAARVEGLVFTHMEVEDGNGAGIRLEQGDLSVSESLFVDGQSGILTAIDRAGSLVVDRSTFSGLGRHPDGNGAHSIYVGRYGSVRVTNCRFERGTGGHYLKSRAARAEFIGNSFDDSRGHDTNYMIDLPNGSGGRIADNVFVNGVGKENYSLMIAVGAEGVENRSDGLVIESNEASLAPGFRWSTTFVGDWSGDRLVIRNNRLARGIALFARQRARE